ncbi:MAG: class A beta-lactamase [Pseudomonadota bacterium]
MDTFLQNQISRRHLVKLGAIASASFLVPGCRNVARPDPLKDRFSQLEAQHGGRLGVTFLDTATGRTAGHRMTERFGLCSTFKLPLAGVILREADAGRLSLDTILPITEDDMVSHAPVTKKHIDTGGMSLKALAEATQKTSDNPAANLLLNYLGGPDAFTQKLRDLGDMTTRLDRYETAMNIVPPGEVRDTTTPLAMAQLIARFLAPDTLSAESRETLIQWMRDTATGKNRLKAGLPPEWKPGNKTGTAYHKSMPNKYNDVAVAWPEANAPVIIACYYEGPEHVLAVRPEDEAVLKYVGEIASTWALEG